MSIAQMLLAEFTAQAPLTRKFLERLPEDKLTWKAHEKSLNAGQLALHIAQVPGGVVRAAQQDCIPLPDFRRLKTLAPAGLQEILQTHDESFRTVCEVLPQFTDARLQQTFRLMQADQEVWTMPRVQFLRDIMLNHWYQHRGQLSVYLRLLNIAVPATWGPSADEAPAFLQKAQSASAANNVVAGV
jgi:uncharacterized damage-inducible protein DinB